MAQLVIAAAGAAIGGAIAPGVVAFGLTGAAIGWQAGALLGSAFVKGPNVQGPRLNDLRVSGTEYGQPIPWCVGAPRIAGQIAWASNKREIANTQKVGKGGGQKVTSYTYEVDLLILLTENEVTGVRRIWSNGELVRSATQTKYGVWNSISVYNGSATQMPDPVYEAAVGVGNAPAYRGHCYVVIQGLQLGNSGAIPNLTFELERYFGEDDGNYSFLANFEGNINDESPNAIFSRLTNPSTSTTTYGYGTGPTGFNSAIYQTVTAGAFNTDGIDYQDISNVGALRLTASQSFTFGFWCRFDTVNITTGNRFLWITNPSLTSLQSLIVSQISGGLQINVSGSAINVTGLSNNTWHFIGLSRTGAGNVRLYANGSLVTSVSTLSFLGDTDRMFLFTSSTTPNTKNNTALDGIFLLKDEDLFASAGFVPSQPFPLQSNQAPLRDVVSDLMDRAGYAADDYDVSGIDVDKVVRAMAVGQVSPTRTILEQLQTVFFFESSKSDRIYFFDRSQSTVASIPFDELGAKSSIDEQANAMELVNANELEIPAQVALTYPNMASDYNNATEYSQRIESTQDSTQTIQIPIGMTPDEAKAVADALLFDQLASLTKTTVRVPAKYARLEPGDVITVTNSDARQYRMRIGQKDDELVYSSLELTLDDVGALDSAALTDGGYTTVDTVRQLAASLWEVMDIPLLSDRDNDPGFYVAISPQPSADPFDWPGAAFARSFSAENYVNEFITDTRCVVGTCETTLGDWTGRPVFDESNSVTVAVSGELSSTTRSAMLADLSVNMCLIGDELVRFRLAEFLGTASGFNRYRLTGLLRGQRGTEQFQTGHVASERFVLLDGALRSIIDQNGQIGAATEVKAVTLNLLLSSVTGEAFTSNSVRLRPFSVANLRALADGADLEITWQRRTRLSYRYGGPMGDSVPLGEASELYRVRIFDGATLVRTVDVTTASYTYTAANAASDGFSSLDAATIQVNQISEIVGEGFPAQTTGVIP